MSHLSHGLKTAATTTPDSMPLAKLTFAFSSISLPARGGGGLAATCFPLLLTQEGGKSNMLRPESKCYTQLLVQPGHATAGRPTRG